MKKKPVDHISNIMSKRLGNFIENFTIFFSNAGKTGNEPVFEFDKFQKNIFWGRYKCNIYILKTNMPWIFKIFIFFTNFIQ